jgi:hypothetical protein
MTGSACEQEGAGMGPPASSAGAGAAAGGGPSLEALRFLHSQVQVRDEGTTTTIHHASLSTHKPH